MTSVSYTGVILYVFMEILLFLGPDGTQDWVGARFATK